MQIEQPAPQEQIPPIWRLAFRAGFLLAAGFAVVGMGRWLYWLWSPESWRSELSPHWWHGHEMVFGFALPVVAGFLLTAVANWTGIAGTRGRPLQVLFGLWLLARGVLWLAPAWSWVAWLAETGFLLLLLAELTRRVWARRQWHNLPFAPLLLLLAGLDATSHAVADNPLASTRVHYGAVWMIACFVVIIGGRVTPLFTANRLGLRITPHPPWFDHLALAVVVLIGLLSALLPASLEQPWLAWLCLAGAAIHLYRLARWQGLRTFGIPLLWSMHLSYLCIPLTLLGLGLSGGDPVAVKNLIHLLAIGTIGGMIIAMMSRVSLGHTGRPLEVPAFIALAFGLVLAAAVVRSLGPLLWAEHTALAWRLSALLWMVAFTGFLVHYVPILTRPRIDGKPG
jgi:uncharacterized protein involved in response to NO